MKTSRSSEIDNNMIWHRKSSRNTFDSPRGYFRAFGQNWLFSGKVGDWPGCVYCDEYFAASGIARHMHTCKGRKDLGELNHDQGTSNSQSEPQIGNFLKSNVSIASYHTVSTVSALSV